ncbi:MAG: hypothetical protein GY711_03725 [bacterium]|nr:hypothetical protein [bacterium]
MRKDSFEQPEARPFDFANLKGCQQMALFNVVDRILVAVRRLKSELPQRNYFEPEQLDAGRSSQIVFVDGRRGSGKTSLQLSLMRLFIDRDLWSKARSWPKCVAKKKKKRKRARKIIKEFGKRSLPSRVVWLHTLDMEPLPKSTNLLAAILTRIERAVRTSALGLSPEESRDEAQQPPWDVFSAGDANPLADLAQLKREVSLAWEGNLKSRAGALDPLAYAAEENDAEVVRLDLNRRLNDVLERLALLGNWSGYDNPLFLLPVDDFDLNPGRCLELMHLVRLIKSPRLLLLVVGDLEVAEHMFRQKILGEITLVSGSAGRGDVALPKDDAARAQSIGAYALRKLIPPAQRVPLEPMSLAEALAYTPSSRPQGEPLKQLLRELPAKFKTITYRKDGRAQARKHRGGALAVGRKRIETIADFLFISGPLEARWASNNEAYSGAAFFLTGPRNVHDFYVRLSAVGKPEELIGLVAEAYHYAVAEEVALTTIERRVFSDAVRQDFQGQWEFHTEGIECVSALGSGPRISELRADRRYSMLGFQGKDFDFRYRTARDRADPRHWRCLSDRTTAAIIILHDLLALKSPTGIVGPRLIPKSSQRVWAAARWDFSMETDLLVPWPSPPWQTFWELCVLRSWWNHALGVQSRWICSRKKRMEFLAYVWISTCTDLVRGLPREFDRKAKVEPWADWLLAVDSEDWSSKWDDLIEALEELAKSCNDESLQGSVELASKRIWLTNLACLLTPEAGLHPEIARKFFASKNTNLRDYWRDSYTVRHVRRWRIRQYARFWLYGHEDLAHILMCRPEKEGHVGEHEIPADTFQQHPIHAFGEGDDKVCYFLDTDDVERAKEIMNLGIEPADGEQNETFLALCQRNPGVPPIPRIAVPPRAPLGYDE